ncbi:TonB-dependent receptor plug domain-containing protein [Parvularcula flava]|uniref:TonB-dependent receptor plug domain-containing protein n=1 Tax=Aquisalinus luteolus TaxID=1566827 RepID=A0ABX0HPY6_9PROT|nr:TonB-dependent receptor plug domain-containing protein [Aquisalinus luteolus]NHK28705.1 TonB-dependent receptor plug domain-containing protein [Aquisalinus luteolus]
MTKSAWLASAAISAMSSAIVLQAAPALAQEAAQESASEDTIVVVGETTNVDINADQIERLQANDLADIFRETPSVSVGGSLGIAQKVYIRGLEDTLLNITVDGAPQTGTLFHHIGRVSIEPELLRQVEVQAGAGEATAGFGAIGGAIRFQTKDAADLLDPGQRFGALLKAGAFSNEGYKASATAYGRLNENWGLLGSYVHVDRDNMEDGDGNTLYGTSAEQSLAFVKLSGEISPNQRLSISHEYRKEEGEFGQRPNWPTLEGDILYPIEA